MVTQSKKSELYHTVESVEDREIIKNELAKMAQIC